MDKLLILALFFTLIAALIVVQHQIQRLPATADVQAIEQRLSRLEQRYTNIHIKALTHKWKEQEVSK